MRRASGTGLIETRRNIFFIQSILIEKKVEEEPIELVTPSRPVSPTQSSPSSSSVDSPVKTGPQGKRSLEKIYDDLNQNQSMFCLFADSEPIDFDKASRSEKWRKAMNEEIGAIEKSDTWELTTLQSGKKPIIARLETIRLLISLAALNKWKIHQIDMKSAFLNGFLDEEVYIEQPKGYVVRGHEDKVLKLKKALYGLKQAPRARNSRIDKYFQERGFKKCPHEHALYVKMNGKCDILIISLYVDDLIFIGNNVKMFDDFKKEMAKEFEMTDIGLMSYYLGIEVKQRDNGIFISQGAYAKKF
ncbi:hypothetical protein RJ639_027175 [Escallonia herrerae]|uniref:Reverse transcriptase Ty1/copia-type domain-containing protein n=1 Tax=Escallonia herrerae TaxID=1293975 RepID=A0AA88XCX5_9ASTE|nr:hypothetical protein RJ639_027175 [Escallonia herrerae]